MITLATPETARFVALNLRDEEVCVRDYGKESAAELCFETARDSLLSWVIFDREGIPVCLFGADGQPSEDWGSAWMFSTDGVSRVGLELVKGVRKAAEYSRNFWPELRIFSEDRSEKQERFLRLVGFRSHSDGETDLVL